MRAKQMKKRGDKNLHMEVMHNLNHTPVGQVLKKIASLPEVRRQKVLNLRRRLTSCNDGLTEGLDAVLDKVLKMLEKHTV